MNNEWNMKGFSERLQYAMKLKGWTVSELARKSQVPKATIHHWTCGKVPRIPQLIEVATTLETSLHELCFGTPDPHERSSVSTDVKSKAGNFRITIEQIK